MYIVQISKDESTWLNIVVGPFFKFEEADQYAEKIKAGGKKAAVDLLYAAEFLHNAETI